MRFKRLSDEELDSDEFLDRADREIFEWYMRDPSAVLMEMANMVGNKVTLESQLHFLITSTTVTGTSSSSTASLGPSLIFSALLSVWY